MLKIFKKCLALAVSGVMLLSAATVFADEASPLVIDGREITSYADVDKISVDTLVTLPKEQLRELAKLKYAEQGEIWNEKEYLELVVQWWMDQPRDQIPPTLFNAQKKVLTQDGVFYDVVPDTRGLAPIAGPYAWEVLGVGDGRDHYVDLAVHLGVAPISTIIRDPAEQAAIISEIEAHKNDGKRLEPAERPDVITYPPSTYTSLDASNGYRDTVSYTSRNTDAYAGPYKLSSTNQSGQNLDRLDGYSNAGNLTNVIFYVWDMNEDMEEEPGYLPFKYVTPGGGATVPFFTWEVRRTSGGSDFYMDTRQVIA